MNGIIHSSSTSSSNCLIIMAQYVILGILTLYVDENEYCIASAPLIVSY